MSINNPGIIPAWTSGKRGTAEALAFQLFVFMVFSGYLSTSGGDIPRLKDIILNGRET